MDLYESKNDEQIRADLTLKGFRAHGTKFEVGAEIDPEAIRLGEAYRAHAFYNKTFDAKTTQLLLFGMLLASGTEAAKHHAQTACRAGASWKELHTVAELASAVSALGPINQAAKMIEDLRAADGAADKKLFQHNRTKEGELYEA